jgi:ADP-ribosyl-[dinitrogen reductase] hydrolase
MSIKGMLIGGFVGDALGVPVEFMDRATLKSYPVIDMRGYGSHHQPKGSWSDDSSMTFALAESILEGYDPEKLGRKFVNWYRKGYYTPHGRIFDIGVGTSRAIARYESGNYRATEAGGLLNEDNGNGSLMRISPLITLLRPLDDIQRLNLVREVSSITHAHSLSIKVCYWFCEYLLMLEDGKDKFGAYMDTNTKVSNIFYSLKFGGSTDEADLLAMKRIFDGEIHLLNEDDITSGGYVIHTMEASLWCFLNSDNYRDAVLKAVNLGDDSDTTGSVTGNMAGLYYGFEDLPIDWVTDLAKFDLVTELAEALEKY